MGGAICNDDVLDVIKKLIYVADAWDFPFFAHASLKSHFVL